MNNRSNGKNKKKSCLTILGLFFLVPAMVIFCLILLEFVFWGLGGVLVIADPLENADAGVILSGGDDTRLAEAALLYQDKYINYLILTETGIEFPELDTSYSAIIRLEAIEMGIPANSIIITPTEVEQTVDEAIAVRETAQANNFKSLIVITDPFHTLRTRLIFTKYFKDTGISISVRPARSHWYKSDTWWTSKAGWEATVGEYVRLFFLPFNN